MTTNSPPIDHLARVLATGKLTAVLDLRWSEHAYAGAAGCCYFRRVEAEGLAITYSQGFADSDAAQRALATGGLEWSRSTPDDGAGPRHGKHAR